MSRSGVSKMTVYRVCLLAAPPFLRQILSPDLSRLTHKIIRTRRYVRVIQAPDHAGRSQEVVYRSAPRLVYAGNAAPHAHNRGHVAHVAVGVPSASVADLNSVREIAFSVQQRQNHHCRVRDDVTVPGISVIPVMRRDVIHAELPAFGVQVIKIHDLAGDGAVYAGGRQVGKAFPQNSADILFHKGITDAGRNEHAAVHPFTVMGNTGSFPRQFRGQVRISRGNQSPGVNENLSADLLRDHGSVLHNASALRRRNPRFQIHKGGMFSRNAVSAPPEKTVSCGHIIQDCLRHVLRDKVLCTLPRIFQCADKEQRSVAVIICRETLVFLQITGLISVYPSNTLPLPAFHRSAQTDTDNFCQPASVDLLNPFTGKKMIFCHDLSLNARAPRAFLPRCISVF